MRSRLRKAYVATEPKIIAGLKPEGRANVSSIALAKEEALATAARASAASQPDRPHNTPSDRREPVPTGSADAG